MKLENLEMNAYRLINSLEFDVYDTEAPKDAIYPYIVYNFRRVNLGFSFRSDFILEVDIWDEHTNYSRVNKIADSIQDLLCDLNNPDEKVLATYYIEGREKIADENKKIKRVQLVYSVQSYFL